MSATQVSLAPPDRRKEVNGKDESERNSLTEEEEEEEADELSPLNPSDRRKGKMRVGRTDWCHCKKCVQMATEEESRCCHEDEEVWLKILENERENCSFSCVVEHPFFTSVCLNPYALRALHSRDSKLFDEDDDEDDTPVHVKYRITAFRAFVEFFHGQLEEDVWGLVPSCAASTIRGLFPEHAFLLRVPGYAPL